jgi:hypothetical protein
MGTTPRPTPTGDTGYDLQAEMQWEMDNPFWMYDEPLNA